MKNWEIQFHHVVWYCSLSTCVTNLVSSSLTVTYISLEALVLLLGWM